ncbi:E3 ubiquitin-protein ligase RNF126 isoform X1 [Vespula pensylvanica]|uniref:E3 ubiquitin-protein ligase RNF126 isoform X1 n=1 Tax=Vespula pensylvanica TaxID=30213 RepID=UPI001CB9E7F2|nr:E3 ubiquitin-protein ligase RNF126 isoform X1 [Vespula pensylvanica]XP_043665797.1 E3 ubiquitin-protein ligase RNF126 isoform X1 [Vespula pensylvanica]XP_050846336.1 E3 ubiquitin-protein ligase RNF126 isoform X1 [Vespula vulgaris]
MAEAVVDGTPVSRFYCHKCIDEIECLQPDYTCPRCSCGFIEELEVGTNDNGSGMDISGEDLSDIDIIDIPGYNRYPTDRDFVEMILESPTLNMQPRAGNRSNTLEGRRRVSWSRNTPDTRRSGRYTALPSRTGLLRHRRGRQEAIPIENFIQDFILNLSGAGLGHPVTQDGQPPVFNIRLFLGNPGDYVWGRDGLDAIVTQLLNQMDGTGPPPLPQKQIDAIPKTTVTQSQVDSKLQCSVCWEDFKLAEPVRQLPCQHFYHTPCIVPWLELHGTCPICRQSLGDQSTAEANQDTVRPSLAALFRAANESNSSRSSSTSSSTGSTSNSDSSNEM